jgi:hypothetical protein
LQINSKYVESVDCDQHTHQLLGKRRLVHVETERTVDLNI